MNERELERLAKSNASDAKKRFLSEYLAQFPHGDAAAAYNYYRKIDSNIQPPTNQPQSNGSNGIPDSGSGLIGIIGSIGGMVNGTLGLISDTTRKISEMGEDVLKSQMGKYENNVNSVTSILNILKRGGLNPFTVGLEGINLLYDEILSQITEESKLLSEVNTKVGISGQLSQALRDDMIAASIEASRYGITLSEIGEFYTELADRSGKFALINRKTIESALPIAAELGKTLPELANTITDYENVGIGADKTFKTISDATTGSISLGLNARKITEGMQVNIGKLNEYGFKNGVKGLEEMNRKSVEFRMNMDETFRIADKVFNPEGAIDLAANMQLIGGAIGDFNDPLKLMYMATNNVEGLQDALISASESLATYNGEQERFEITGINLRRARAMADALGVSFNELTKGAIAAAERTQAASMLMSTGLQMDESDKEFLLNISRMQGGELKIVVPESLQDKLGKQNEIILSDLTDKQKEVLLANKKAFEEMNPEKIAMAQLTEIQQMSRGIDVIAAYYRVIGVQKLKGVSEPYTKELMRDMRSAIDAYGKNINYNANEREINKVKVEKIGLPEYIKEEGMKVIDAGKKTVKYVEKLITVQHNHTFSSDNTLDEVRRQMLKNSGFSLDVINDSREYTSPQEMVS